MSHRDRNVPGRWAALVAVVSLLALCLVLLGGGVGLAGDEMDAHQPPSSGLEPASPHSVAASYEPHIRLEKNPTYYDAGAVAIDEVTSLFIDEDEAWARYQLGELDTIAPPESALDAIKASPVYSPQLHIYPRSVTQVYLFSNDVPPFDDLLVRAAFASAIDRPRVISEALTGDELPTLTLTPPRHVGYVDGYAAGIGRPYSPTLAAALLAASGYVGDPPITLLYNTNATNQAIAEAVRQSWIDTLGIAVTLEDMEWSDYMDLLNNGSAEERPGVFRQAWASDYPDADDWHGSPFGAFGGYWGPMARYSNPAYDALVEAAAGETDPTARLALYEQAEATLTMTDTTVAPLYNLVNRRLTRPDLARTYRSNGGQRLGEWVFSGDARPLEIAWPEPGSLDPAKSWDSNYVNQLFLGLTDIDPATGAAVPELATAWDMSPDATVFTFTLRSDATWTDSSPVTAYDVEYGVLRSLAPETGSGTAWLLWDIENAKDYNEGSITDPDLVGVEALDATHIRFTLEGPAVYFPGIAGVPPARPQPQWAIDAYGEDWTDPDNIVSNGPYILAAWLRNAPWMRVNYGDHWESNAVGLNYPAGHTVWLTVTDEFDTVKATATMLTEVDGGWPPDDGFLWTEAADWAPSQPDILPEDCVYARSDEGYTHTLRVGAISAVVDFSDNSVSGYVRAPWFSETLPVVCSPGTMWPGEWSDSTAEPDGSVPYYCQWDPAVWDIEPGDTFDVRYEEADGDWVFNTFRAEWYTYLPMVFRGYIP